MYVTISNFLKKYLKQSTIFKYGFNISPMYRRSTGKINYVSEDLLKAQVKIPITYKNKNYVGSIFGGSLFSATDPVFMIQLMNILGNDYVVWDKEASIKFKRPVKQDAYVDFIFSENEIKQIKEQVKNEQKIDLIKEIKITNKDESVVFAEVSKTIYIADKTYYKNKRKKK
ncbi:MULTISPECIES: DUF4442 domain-containing protein [unclassified Tenacibaculum]|uniref:DUF4442 domain-containing protein n=1 Tax=unclassified Tenacibaculum TaxID=2635139 RepID=UPI00237AC63F|nr:DUF4442 domain-containing protein [Tenacibaculum sp. L6]MDE0534929.1 YiiD C-terminal domain-containing protein [Tenacibaculum sp. L6]